MTDSTDDLDYISIAVTYCPKHYGLWTHECGCETEDEEYDEEYDEET